jgi:hypothetical protein
MTNTTKKLTAPIGAHLTAVQIEKAAIDILGGRTTTDAAKVMPPRLLTIGKEIEAKLAKADTYQGKATDMVESVKELLVEAAKLCDDSGFNMFRKHFCPSLSKSRAYEILAIASGKKSVAQSRAEGAARQAKHMAKLKAATVVPLRSAPTDASAKALAEFKFSCNTWLPKMNLAEIDEAKAHLRAVAQPICDRLIKIGERG